MGEYRTVGRVACSPTWVHRLGNPSERGMYLTARPHRLTVSITRAQSVTTHVQFKLRMTCPSPTIPILPHPDPPTSAVPPPPFRSPGGLVKSVLPHQAAYQRAALMSLWRPRRGRGDGRCCGSVRKTQFVATPPLSPASERSSRAHYGGKFHPPSAPNFVNFAALLSIR